MARRVAAVERPWALPDGWRWERIDDVAPVNPRRAADGLSDDTAVSFVPMAAVAAETGGIDISARRPIAAVRKGFTRFGSGDVIFAKITPCMENGKIAVIPEPPYGAGFGSTEFHVMAPHKVSSRYLYYWVSQRSFRETAEFNMTGTAGQKRVPTDFMRDTLIPVPVAGVQHRIVARIDELFAEIDDGEAALARLRDDLATWRKALLKAAVTGELTADWRAANSAAETGGDLLARILADRRLRWEAEPKNKAKRYVEPSRVAELGLPRLPDGWAWSAMGQLLDRIEAGLNVKCVERAPNSAETGLLKISAVTWWRFNERASKTLADSHVHPDEWLIANGDLLVSRANTLELVGAPAVVEGLSLRLMLSDKVLRLAMPTSLRRWTFYVMRSPFGRAWIEARATGNQLSMRNISQDALREMPIPLPPRTELDRIVKLLDAASSQHETTKSNVSVLDTAAATLRQSILAAAFRGELA